MVTQRYIRNEQSQYFNCYNKELAWRSGSVMDCHTTTWGSIPGGNDRASLPLQGTVNKGFYLYMTSLSLGRKTQTNKQQSVVIFRKNTTQKPFSGSVFQGSYRSLKCLKVLEIHHWFFKALKSLKNSTFLVKVLKSP